MLYGDTTLTLRSRNYSTKSLLVDDCVTLDGTTAASTIIIDAKPLPGLCMHYINYISPTQERWSGC
jgi:hypothetical protein